MLDIWMNSIARAGGIEVPQEHFTVQRTRRLEPIEATLTNVPDRLHTDGRLVKIARWLEVHLAPRTPHCEA